MRPLDAKVHEGLRVLVASPARGRHTQNRLTPEKKGARPSRDGPAFTPVAFDQKRQDPDSQNAFASAPGRSTISYPSRALRCSNIVRPRPTPYAKSSPLSSEVKTSPPRSSMSTLVSRS